MTEPAHVAPAVRLTVAAGLAALACSAATAGAQAIFLDGFEVGNVCYWSSSVPSFPCGPYQTCADASGAFWGCFELPFAAPPEPALVDGDWLVSDEDLADVYVLFDRSGDMTAESNSLRANLATVQNNVTCPPVGTGTPGSCYPDLWMGVGLLNYSVTVPSYENFIDLQPNPFFAGIPLDEPAGCCAEAGLLSTWASVTGLGSADSGCMAGAFPARATCVGSPAQAAGYATYGYPCFRNGALAMVVFPMSEDPAGTLVCPSSPSVIAAAGGAGVRIVGLLGSGAPASAVTFLDQLAIGTGAVDPANNNAPLVFWGPDAAASSAVESLLLRARSLFAYPAVTGTVVDDPSDSVDVVAAFVDYLEATDAAAGCTPGLATEDRDLDGHPDTYLAVPFGATLCFRVVARENSSVAAASTAQNFPGSLDLTLDGVPLVSLALLFLVPPG